MDGPTSPVALDFGLLSLFSLVVLALSVVVWYWVMRLAFRHALRDHFGGHAGAYRGGGRRPAGGQPFTVVDDTPRQ